MLNTASRSVSNGSIGKMGPWPVEQPIPNKERKKQDMENRAAKMAEWPYGFGYHAMNVYPKGFNGFLFFDITPDKVQNKCIST